MNKFVMRAGRRVIPIVAAGLVAVACGETMGPVDDHSEPEGLTLSIGGNTLVTVDGQTVTGHIDVDEGMETAHITVTFTDHDGDPITFDSDFYLEVVVDDTTIAVFNQDTPGEFGGHVEGLMAGMTDAHFQVMHGTVGSGHADYVSPGVELHVDP